MLVNATVMEEATRLVTRRKRPTIDAFALKFLQRRRVELHARDLAATCCSGQVGTLWRELGEAMDRVAYSQAVADRMVVAAHEGFRALSRWRRNDPHHETGIRIAG